jgi:hypothetical protein
MAFFCQTICKKTPNFPKKYYQAVKLVGPDNRSKSEIWLFLFVLLLKQIVKAIVRIKTTTKRFVRCGNIFPIKICFQIDGLFVWASNVRRWLIGKMASKKFLKKRKKWLPIAHIRQYMKKTRCLTKITASKRFTFLNSKIKKC